MNYEILKNEVDKAIKQGEKKRLEALDQIIWDLWHNDNDYIRYHRGEEIDDIKEEMDKYLDLVMLISKGLRNLEQS